MAIVAKLEQEQQRLILQTGFHARMVPLLVQLGVVPGVEAFGANFAAVRPNVSVLFSYVDLQAQVSPKHRRAVQTKERAPAAIVRGVVAANVAVEGAEAFRRG